MQDINAVKFPEETIKAIHAIIAAALERAAQNGTLKPLASLNP